MKIILTCKICHRDFFWQGAAMFRTCPDCRDQNRRDLVRRLYKDGKIKGVKS